MMFLRYVLFFTMVSVLLGPAVEAGAERVDREMGAQQESLRKVKKDINEKKRILRNFEEKERGLLGQIQALDEKLVMKEEQLASFHEALQQVLEEKSRIVEEMKAFQPDLVRFQGYLSFKVNQLYRHGSYSYVKALFSAENYSDLLKRYRYVKLMAREDRANIEAYQKVVGSLSEKRQELAEREEKIAALKKAFEEKNQEIFAKREKRRRLLQAIRKEKDAQKKLLGELEQSALSLYQAIEELRQKKQSLFGHFEHYKGQLPWPLDGEVITKFGRHKHEKFNTYIFSHGIDIAAQKGDEARAVYKGTVLFADWFKGYGQMVIVDHGKGFYSVYAHLSRILVPVKGVVEAGQPIGRVGETGALKGTVLYFEIRYHGEPQDPLTWLARR
jgi:septal ring factor EnvC (AmiA/AmiB activator)